MVAFAKRLSALEETVGRDLAGRRSDLLRFATDEELEEAISILERNKVSQPDELPAEERERLEELWAKVFARRNLHPSGTAVSKRQLASDPLRPGSERQIPGWAHFASQRVDRPGN